MELEPPEDFAELLEQLTEPEVQAFLQGYHHADVTRLALQRWQLSAPRAAVLGQLASRQKAESKLPTWFQTPGIIFPPKENLEQSSDERVALWRARQFEAKRVVDLTGGFGVDFWAHARGAEEATNVEPNPWLQTLARHNLPRLLNCQIHYFQGKAEDYLAQAQPDAADLVFVDPSRRVAGQRLAGLDQCEPDMVSLLPAALGVAPLLVIKASPMVDLTEVRRQLGANLREQWVIALQNEVKEVCLVARREEGPCLVRAVDLYGLDVVEFSGEAPASASALTLSQADGFIYEPSATLLKAGLADVLAKQMGLAKLHPHTHLYTSSELHRQWQGRVHKLVGVSPANGKGLATLLPGKAARVAVRNFPLTADQLRQKLKLKEDDNNSVLGCQTVSGLSLLVLQKLLAFGKDV